MKRVVRQGVSGDAPSGVPIPHSGRDHFRGWSPAFVPCVALYPRGPITTLSRLSITVDRRLTVRQGPRRFVHAFHPIRPYSSPLGPNQARRLSFLSLTFC